MSPFLALLIAYGSVFLVMGVATVLDKINLLNDEGSRKFIHIGVSNWWILAMFLFDSTTYYLAIIPPLTFIGLNYLSYRLNLVKAMERDERSPSDLGTVYYAMSLSLITLIAFYYDLTYIGALAILAMGYGDGLSAVIGKAVKSKKLYQNKSLAGTTTMFVVTLIIGLILFPAFWPLMILIALLAAVVELLTPRGLDNLSVPLLIFLIGVLLL